MIGALVRQDILLAMRSAGSWLQSFIFFAVFCTLCAIGLKGETTVMAAIGPALIWLAAIMAMLLSFDRAWQMSASEDGLSQLTLAGVSMTRVTLAKLVSTWIILSLPLLLLTFPAAYSFGMDDRAILGLLLGLLIGTPAILVYGLFSGACVLGQRQGAMILIILTAPLMMPTLIFGVILVQAFIDQTPILPSVSALAGTSLIALAFGIPATAAALDAQRQSA